MKVYAKTRKTHYWNEDRFIIGKDYFMVIDGATPLIKVNNFNEACWMVNYIKKNINKFKGNIKERLLVLSKDGFNKLPVKMKDEEYLPSAGMAWVEYDDKYFLHLKRAKEIHDDWEKIYIQNMDMKRLDEFMFLFMMFLFYTKKILKMIICIFIHIRGKIIQ